MNRIIVELASVSLTKTSVFATFSIKKNTSVLWSLISSRKSMIVSLGRVTQYKS